jgi:hypothetical protein
MLDKTVQDIIWNVIRALILKYIKCNISNHITKKLWFTQFLFFIARQQINKLAKTIIGWRKWIKEVCALLAGFVDVSLLNDFVSQLSRDNFSIIIHIDV